MGNHKSHFMQLWNEPSEKSAFSAIGTTGILDLFPRVTNISNMIFKAVYNTKFHAQNYQVEKQNAQELHTWRLYYL